MALSRAGISDVLSARLCSLSFFCSASASLLLRSFSFSSASVRSFDSSSESSLPFSESPVRISLISSAEASLKPFSRAASRRPAISSSKLQLTGIRADLSSRSVFSSSDLTALLCSESSSISRLYGWVSKSFLKSFCLSSVPAVRSLRNSPWAIIAMLQNWLRSIPSRSFTASVTLVAPSVTLPSGQVSTAPAVCFV